MDRTGILPRLHALRRSSGRRLWPAFYHWIFLLLAIAEPKLFHPFASTNSSDDVIFKPGLVRGLRIELSEAQIELLRRKPRHDVRATLRDGKSEFRDVRLHLKGSTGSFQPIDQKPSFTLNFKESGTNNGFHGLYKIHLNNSLEDPAFVNEIIGSELFNAVGIPAPRVTRALVILNGKALGLYVLKEGIDEHFLKGHFGTGKGAIYEPIQGSDVNGRFERRAGRPSDVDPFQSIRSALEQHDPEKKWFLIERALDLDKFLTFMALEVILGHRDGYSLARNNYRVYEDPSSHRIQLIPEGMDQLFAIPNLAWNSNFGGALAKAVMDNEQARQQYRTRLNALFFEQFNVKKLTNRIAESVEELVPILARSQMAALREASEAVATRIEERGSVLHREFTASSPSSIGFGEGAASLVEWRPTDATTAVLLDQPILKEGRRALHILARQGTTASWRTEVTVDKGRYQFAGSARIKGVAGSGFGRNHGAGLRLIGVESDPYTFVGDSDWKELKNDVFVVTGTKMIELACELRADAGEVWFDMNSLHLIKLDE